MTPTQTTLHIPSKLPQSGTSIFTVMSQLAVKYQAINLAQGFPDFSCPNDLSDLVCDYIYRGFNQYAPMPGVMPLREKISRKTAELYNYLPHPETEITVTSGATEALFAAISAVVTPGDEVIVLEPAYDSYVPAIVLNGGIPVFVPLMPPTFEADWDAVKAKISPKTKLIIVNSPHNPTGMVFSENDLKQLAGLIQETSAFLISDEVYEHIIFDGQQHQSVLRIPELAARSFVISSFGKTYHTTGWKVGYCIAPPALTTEFRKVHQFLTFSTVTPIQFALADYLDKKAHYLGLPKFYEAKRNHFRELMQGTKFELLPCAGTYFQLARYNAISDLSDQEFARKLTMETGVATIPVSAFYHNHTDHKLLRFCFAKNESTLQKATSALHQL